MKAPYKGFALVIALVALVTCAVVFAHVNAQQTEQQTTLPAGTDTEPEAVVLVAADPEAPAAEAAGDAAPLADSVRDAQASSEAPSAAQVYDQASSRGFSEAQVQGSFDLEGTYHDPATLDEASETVWPSYYFSYTSVQGVLWMVYVNDGTYVAVPFSCGAEVLSKQIIFSEKDYITQYDGQKNEYSNYALDNLPSSVRGVKVDSLDAATLDAYSFEQLKAM